MIGFGRYNQFPFTLGGGPSSVEDEHNALLSAYAPGYDVSDEQGKAAIAFAHASAIANGWAMDGRLGNQTQPLKMLEALTLWEQATSLRPSTDDLDIDRRRAVASKLRGIANNTVTDVAEAAKALLGNNFVAANVVPPADEVVYWPGGPGQTNGGPGPPGYEWSTNRATVQLTVTKAGLSDREFDRLMSLLLKLLSGMLPAWMTFTVNQGSGFIVEESLIGEMGL